MLETPGEMLGCLAGQARLSAMEGEVPTMKAAALGETIWTM
jgi:hypothetical protein